MGHTRNRDECTREEARAIIRHGRTGGKMTQTIYGCGEKHFQMWMWRRTISGLISSKTSTTLSFRNLYLRRNSSSRYSSNGFWRSSCITHGMCLRSFSAHSAFLSCSTLIASSTSNHPAIVKFFFFFFFYCK